MTDASPLALDQLRQLASRLTRVSALGSSDKALLGFALGAIYSLDRALSLGYEDRTGDKLPSTYPDELRENASAIAHGQDTTDAWLAGYFFNNALLRIVPLGECIGKYVSGQKWDVEPSIRKDVNRMKHEIERVIDGRGASMTDALRAVTMIVAAIELLHLRDQPKKPVSQEMPPNPAAEQQQR